MLNSSGLSSLNKQITPIHHPSYGFLYSGIQFLSPAEHQPQNNNKKKSKTGKGEKQRTKKTKERARKKEEEKKRTKTDTPTEPWPGGGSFPEVPPVAPKPGLASGLARAARCDLAMPHRATDSGSVSCLLKTQLFNFLGNMGYMSVND